MNIANNIIKYRELKEFFTDRGIVLKWFFVHNIKLLEYVKQSILMAEDSLGISYLKGIEIQAAFKKPLFKNGLNKNIHADTVTGIMRFDDHYIFSIRVDFYRRLANKSYKRKIKHMADDLQIDTNKIVYAVIIHELMHVFVYKLWLISNEIKVWEMEYAPACKMANDERFYEFQDKICEKIIESMNCTRDDIEREVNSYAVYTEKKHYTEFLAECLTEYILSNHPRRMAVGVFQEMQRIIQKMQWE